MNRREFHRGVSRRPAFMRPRHCAAAPFPVRFRKASPQEKLAQYILPGNDEFRGREGRHGHGGRQCAGKWAPGRYYVLPGGRVRYEIARTTPAGLEYRVGRVEAAPALDPLGETVERSPRPLFRDVTAAVVRRL